MEQSPARNGSGTPTSDSFRREGATSLCSSSEDQTRRDPGKEQLSNSGLVRPGPAGTMGNTAGGIPLQSPPLPAWLFLKTLKSSEPKALPGGGSGEGAPSSSGPALPSGAGGGRAGGLALGLGEGRGPEEEPLSRSLGSLRLPGPERGVRAAPGEEKEEEEEEKEEAAAPARDAGGTAALLPLLGHLPRRQDTGCVWGELPRRFRLETRRENAFVFKENESWEGTLRVERGPAGPESGGTRPEGRPHPGGWKGWRDPPKRGVEPGVPPARGCGVGDGDGWVLSALTGRKDAGSSGRTGTTPAVTPEPRRLFPPAPLRARPQVGLSETTGGLGKALNF